MTWTEAGVMDSRLGSVAACLIRCRAFDLAVLGLPA
jgi:hypothetical protein